MIKYPKIHGHSLVSRLTRHLKGDNGMIDVWVNIRTGFVGYEFHHKPVDYKDYPDTSDIKHLYFTVYPLTVKDIRYKAEQCILESEVIK